MADRKYPFVRFFSAVEGHIVSRYGTASRTQGPLRIGVTRDDGGSLKWDTESIVALTAVEANVFKREYDRAVIDGGLKERTYEDYLAFLEADAAKAKAAAEADKRKSTPAPISGSERRR